MIRRSTLAVRAALHLFESACANPTRKVLCVGDERDVFGINLGVLAVWKNRARSLRGATLGLAIASGLAACDEAASLNAPATATSFQATSGPGAKVLTVAAASELFKAVCVNTFPSVAKAKSVLTANGFGPSPETGTFYDGKRDASFSLKPRAGKKRCSMVFTSREKAIDLGVAFAFTSLRGSKAAIKVQGTAGNTSAPSAGNSTMTFAPASVAQGKAYYRAVLVAN